MLYEYSCIKCALIAKSIINNFLTSFNFYFFSLLNLISLLLIWKGINIPYLILFLELARSYSQPISIYLLSLTGGAAKVQSRKRRKKNYKKATNEREERIRKKLWIIITTQRTFINDRRSKGMDEERTKGKK